MIQTQRERPFIFMYDGKVCHHGQGPTRFTIDKENVRVGCTEVSHEAVEHIYKKMQEYKKRVGEEVVQP